MNRPAGLPRALAVAVLALAASMLAGCQTRPPLPIMPSVDVDRFMGSWYVIACIPSRIERHDYQAIESYRRASDGRILTTFTFRQGSMDGPLKTYRPIGRVRSDGNGAVWGMQFVWPIQADYRVMFVDPNYRMTVIGRRKRDYAWIMARAPTLEPETLRALTERLRAAGYDISQLRHVPQRAAE